jgi:zinc-binding in reverse transcriptase
MNQTLLCKWLWRFHNSNESGLWKQIIQARYTNRRSLINVSTFWKEVNKELHIFNISINKHVSNGNNTLFWKDRWLNECSLRTQYSLLYELTANKDITIAYVIEINIFYLSFTRTLNSTLSDQLHNLYQSLSNIILNQNQDQIIWRWNSNGSFSTKSCYEWLEYRGVTDFPYKQTWLTWSTKMPLKIKFFLWLVKKNRILTKNNLLKI